MIVAHSQEKTWRTFISSMLKRYRRSRMLIAFVILSLATVPGVLAQGDVSFTAEVDKTTISLDDLLTLKLTLAGDFQQLGEPQFPLLSGINIVGSSRSSQFSMVNGVVQARTIFTYRLQPTRYGTFTIDPIRIVVNGSSYQTEPITVQVTEGSAPGHTREPDEESSPEPDEGPSADQTDGATPKAPLGLTGQDLFVEADVDNAAPYVGQQIIFTFRFYQAINLFDQPRLDWPNFSGFWTEALTPNSVYEVILSGRRYRVTEIRQALFPTSPGQTTIGPAKLNIPGGFFGSDTVLATETLIMAVQPLPAGAPDGFAGAVGKFEIETWAEPLETRVNEPVTLFVRIRGEGNLATLPDPTEEAEDLTANWRIYASQTTTNVTREGETIRGDKQFERLLVPITAGELSIPSFFLVFFDPEIGAYERIETEPLAIQAAPSQDAAPGLPSANDGKQGITVLATDIRHIKPAPPSLATQRTKALEQPIYWLGWLLPPLTVSAVWAWQRRQRRLCSDGAQARARRAHALARGQLSQARRQVGDEEEIVYSTVARAFAGYLGDKFNLPSAGLTRDDIQRALIGRDVPTDLIDRSLACLDWADSGRFAPVAAGRDANALITEAETITAELERLLSLR